MTRNRQVRAVPLSALLAILIIVAGYALHALADSRTVEDERDEGQTVDPISASHGHRQSLRGILVHTIRMAEPWQDGDLLGGGIEIWLPDNDRHPDRQIIIGFNENKSMYALVRDSERTRYIGHANIWMPDDRTIQVEVARALAVSRFDQYRWRVTVAFVCQEQGVVCAPQRDRIPNRGRVLHQL